jgi:hypothetical protein
MYWLTGTGYGMLYPIIRGKYLPIKVKSCQHSTRIRSHSMDRLVIASNRIESIPFPTSAEQCLPLLKHLSLSHNQINSWAAIDALAAWCPALESIAVAGNPLTGRVSPKQGDATDPVHLDHDYAHSRPLIISKIPSLTTLEGTIVSAIRTPGVMGLLVQSPDTLDLSKRAD